MPKNRLVKISLIGLFIILTLYVAIWFSINKDLKNSVEEFRNQDFEDISISFDYELSGFPFSNKVTIYDFKAIYYEDFEGDKRKVTESVEFKGDMVVEKSVFSNTLTLNLPKRIKFKDRDIISEYVFGNRVLFEVYTDFSVIDIILDALHISKMSDEDLFQSFRGFRYYDDGMEMLINNKVIASSDKSEIKFLFDIPDKEINSSLIIFFDKIKMTEAYYNYQREIMLNAMGGSEYEQKLVDYIIEFGMYAGDVSVDIDVEYLADQPSEQKQNTPKTVSPIKFNGHNLSINSFKITDNLGSSDLTGKLSYEINNKQYEVKDLVYKLDNFENVLEKYLSLLSSLSSLRNKYGASDPKTALILAMVPRQDDLYSMVPLVKRGTIEFFKAINAVNGKNLELRIASPKDSDDVTINDYNIKDLMPIMQKSFEPVMEQMNRKRMQEMRNRDTQAQQNSI